MRRVWLCLALLACGDPWMDPERTQTTEVVVVPVPRGPGAPSAIGPAEVEALVRAARPDVLFVEVPAASMEAVHAAARRGVAHRWLSAKPDVLRLLRMADQVGVVVEPISAWDPEVGRDWRAFVAGGWPTDPLYERARAQRIRRDQDEGDDPDWVLSVARQRLVAWENTALEGAAPGRLGAAAPSRLVRAHVERMNEALDRHEGRRVVIAIDAKYAAALERAAAARFSVRIVEPLAFEAALQD